MFFRPKKQFKIIPTFNNTNNFKNLDKSFNDSGLSENCGETLPRLDETSSLSNQQQISSNLDQPLHIEIDTNNNNDNKQQQFISLTPTLSATNENPAATSTPQIKKIDSHTEREELLMVEKQEEKKVQIIPTITITPQMDENEIINKDNSQTLEDNSTTITAININKRTNVKPSTFTFIIIFLLIAIIFIFLLPKGIASSIYTTVKSLLTFSVNSVSLSVQDSLRNSQLLFDPIFSFFLRNYPDV